MYRNGSSIANVGGSYVVVLASCSLRNLVCCTENLLHPLHNLQLLTEDNEKQSTNLHPSDSAAQNLRKETERGKKKKSYLDSPQGLQSFERRFGLFPQILPVPTPSAL